MNDMIKQLLQKIHTENPEELSAVKADIDKLNAQEPENPISDSVFEVDGQLHKVPFEALKSYLNDQQPIQALRGNRIPAPQANRKSIKDSPSSFDIPTNSIEDADTSEHEYYWDNPEVQYNHMNPEAVKDKVLRKLR